MKIYRSGSLPPDLKSFARMTRHEDQIEAMRTIVALLLMAVILLLVMFVAVPSEPLVYPDGWEEVRR